MKAFMSKHSRWTLPGASVLVASLVVMGVWFQFYNSEPQNVHVVREASFIDIFSELEPLTAKADVVVIGTVTKIAESGLDRGRDGDGHPIPYTIYEFEVQERVKGAPDSTIYVYRTDPSYLPNEPLTKLNVGETLALYLRSRSASLAPTVTVADTLYVPIALDNGVFDVLTSDGAVGIVNEETVVRPRGIRGDMFAEGTEFTAAQIRQAIVPEGDTGPVGETN